MPRIHDFRDLPPEADSQALLRDKLSKNPDLQLDETFYIRESTLLVRQIKAYVVKIQDILETCVREKQAKIDDEEFQYYYSKIFDSLLDLRMFKENLFKKLK